MFAIFILFLLFHIGEWFFVCFAQFLTSNPSISVKPSEEQLPITDPNYGITWMLFPDEFGEPHFVDLTLTFNDTSAARAGSDFNNDITFYFYRKNTMDSPSMFKMVDESKPLSIAKTFDPVLPTKFVIHGWKSSSQSDIGQNIKNAYLTVSDMNVICKWFVKRLEYLKKFGL